MTFPEIASVLSSKSVGIAGCGGLGSNCAVALARTGIGRLVLADFDVVSISNLNRQYYFLHQAGVKKVFALKENMALINPQVQVETHDVKLSPSDILRIFKDCDIIVEAFDLAEMKKMIIETVLSEMPEKIIVSGLGMSGYGNSNSIKVKQIGALFICGDGHSGVSEDQPPLAPRVGIVANMQANTVIELLLNEQAYGNNIE